nr:ribonuclease H-like domain-containing protein [Tanacetum cinerariifolium]
MRKSMLKQEFLEFRISEAEGLHKGYDRMQKILSQLKQLNAKPDAEEINLSNVIKDVLHLFVVDTEPEQQLAYEDLEQVDKLDLEEMDLKWQMAMLSNKEIGRKEEDLKALVSVATFVDWSNHDSECNEVIAAKEFGMIAGCDFTDAIKAGANKLYNMINGANSEETNTPDTLDNHFVQTEKWKTSSKNLYKLIDSSMSVRTKVGLGFTHCISKNELGWDDSAFSVFTTTSEDMEDHSDLDESQMSYGIKSSTSCDPKSVPNDSVSYDDSDKSSEDNTNDLTSSDSGLKSSKHKSTDSFCASTSSVSTSVNGAEIDSNVGIPTKEPISVQDFPSFTCHGSNKNEHSSRTSCNKHGSFNKSQITNTTDGIRVGPTVKPQPVLVPQRLHQFLLETPFLATEDEGIFDSGCSRSMTGNKDRLDDFQAIHGGKVTFGGGKGRITGKGTIRTPTLDFENVYYVKELQQFNFFSIS